MTISQAMDDLWKVASNEGFTEKLVELGDDEDIIVFALNFLLANINDVFEMDEVDSESSAGQEAWDDLMDVVDTYLGEDDE